MDVNFFWPKQMQVGRDIRPFIVHRVTESRHFHYLYVWVTFLMNIWKNSLTRFAHRGIKINKSFIIFCCWIFYYYINNNSNYIFTKFSETSLRQSCYFWNAKEHVMFIGFHRKRIYHFLDVLHFGGFFAPN